MKLLNIVFCVLFVFTSYNTHAQKSNVQNAYRALEKKKIEEAVQYIELAAANSKTANDVKMHNYRGKIYYEIYSNDDYKTLDPIAILKCANSWISLYNHPKVKAHVSFTHGEGFGRPLLEATLSEKPVIASNWSGQVDFLNQDSILLPGNLIDVPKNSFPKEFIVDGAQWFQVIYQIPCS